MSSISNHFKTIYEQREEFINNIKSLKNKEWEQPCKDKWSIGENYYHLFLMIKRFRQLSSEKCIVKMRKPSYSY